MSVPLSLYVPQRYLIDSDLNCGEYVNVYGRNLLLVKCDRHTMDYCAQQGRPQKPIEVFAESPIAPKRVYPSYNGYEDIIN